MLAKSQEMHLCTEPSVKLNDLASWIRRRLNKVEDELKGTPATMIGLASERLRLANYLAKIENILEEGSDSISPEDFDKRIRN